MTKPSQMADGSRTQQVDSVDVESNADVQADDEVQREDTSCPAQSESMQQQRK